VAETNEPIYGISRDPYIEVTGHEQAEHNRWSAALKYAAFGSIAIVGVRFVGSRVSFQIDPDRLTYLSMGLNTPGETPWHEVRGKTLTNGKIDASIGDIMLELTKRGEELFGGIPRTFGLYGAMSRHIFNTPQTNLHIPGSALEGAEDHYRALIGRSLLPDEMLYGIQVAPFSEADLEGYVRSAAKRQSLVLSDQEVAKRVQELIAEGKASPGKAVGLFNLDENKALKELIVPDVKIANRIWEAEGPIDPKTGFKKHRHVIRQADILSTEMGARPISHTNEFRYMVYKVPEEVRLAGTTRELVETFVSPDRVEGLINNVVGPKGRVALQEAEILGKTLSERYLRLLDQPLEMVEDFLGQQDLFGKVKGSKGYARLKNIFGTGGDYSGTMIDLWGRHAKRLIPIGLGLAAAYEVGSRITEFASDKSLAQVGGEAVGAGQRLFASISDKTGLTSLNKAQEREAEGSHRLLGVLAFPFAGAITGGTIASLTSPIAAEAGRTSWITAREEIHELPKALSSLKRDLPIVGDLSKPMTRGKKFAVVGGVIGAAMSLPFLLGSLGSNKSYDEVVAEQRGETEVAVRKGAMWEGGRTDIEGEEIQYHRPGWFAKLMDAPNDELQFGEYADRPFTRLLKGIVDPYWREKELYHERPYPITGPDTSGFGPLGTIWGMTIGRVLKPPKMMHTDELSAGGAEGARDGEVVQFGQNVSEAPSGLLGGLGPTPVVSPYDQSFLAGELGYKVTEAIGLPGFVFSSVKKAITGSPDFGSDEPVLASFADIGSMRDSFWDSGIAGGFTTTEGLRRFIPKERFQLQKINPISNQMPDWMPGLGNYIDFTHGDPYQLIPEGEYRLPGAGYEKRFQELEGLDPNDYPDIHKYRILADVAPFSAEFKAISRKVEGLAEGNELSERDRMLYDATKIELRDRAQKIKFREEPDSLVGKYWAGITKLGRMNPVEHLLPISPVHKFAGPVDPITEYEDRVLYSTRNPSWDSPIEDFIAPAISNAGHLLGADGIPGRVQERRDLTEYFDKLEYIKYKRLENNARNEGEGAAAFAFSKKAQYTMFGADPYQDIDTVKKVLPREELPFFEAFVATTSQQDRGRILEMVPNYTRKFYVAQWQKQIYAGLAAKGNLSADEEQAVIAIEAARASEGESADIGLSGEYLAKSKMGMVRENTFPDYIRARKLESYFDDAPYDAPSADWIGYSPAVSMDDVKLKVVQAEGLDYHDFELWENDAMMARRKPYLEEAASDVMDSNLIREDLTRSLTSMRIGDLHVDVVPTTGDKTRISLDIRTDRKKQLDREMTRYER
jgi:hypothetical protein